MVNRLETAGFSFRVGYPWCMPSRLLLGCGAGTVGHALAELGREHEEPRFHVVTTDPEQREFPQRGVTITAADPADVEVLREIEGEEAVASVFVGTDSPERNVAIARAATEVFESTPIVAYSGQAPTEDDLETLESLVDRVVDQGAVLGDHIDEAVLSEAARRARDLRRLLVDIDGRLAVLLHDNPDPDAIASGIALTRLARSFGVDADAYYFGNISHQENRALVNVLDLALHDIDDPEPVIESDAIALVDHSLPGVNDQLPERTPVDIVIDHHPSPGPVGAEYVDVRSDIGSTSTMLIEYFTALDVGIDESLATALFFGLQTDTDDFSRGITQLDFEMAAEITSIIDRGVLDRIERPTISQETFETLGRAIRNKQIRGGVCTSCVGQLRDRDALAQAADRLLDMEGINTTLVYGFAEGTAYVSARARGTDLDIGDTLRDAFDRIGSAGGHADMAGAQIPLGFLGQEADEDSEELLTRIVREVIDGRFFETLPEHREGGSHLPDEPDDWVIGPDRA